MSLPTAVGSYGRADATLGPRFAVRVCILFRRPSRQVDSEGNSQ